ncbi:hypothetical protein JCM10213_003605 [Rhodosporidiobolus nylandii]
MKTGSVAALSALVAVASALSHDGMSSHGPARLDKRCSATISSLDDVSEAIKCTTININEFTVPAGKTFELKLKEGTVVNVRGDITFGTKNWAGPLVEVSGTDITFNGNGYKWDGNGAYYWDGKGSNGGVTKPKFFKVKFSGQMSDVYLYNQPVQGFSVSNPAKLVMDGITVDVEAGASKGHNTDAFDVSSSKYLTIQNSNIYNQDDCIAINDAENLTFQNNYCSGGHGISIGSIKTGKNVDGVTIKGNTVVDSQQGLRIKTYSGAEDASVSNVVYDGNTVTNASKYGVVIQQDYTNEGATGKATAGVPIKNVRFSGSTSTVEVGSKAQRVYVLCAKNSCSGFDFSKLKTSGGSAGSATNVQISGYSI